MFDLYNPIYNRDILTSMQTNNLIFSSTVDSRYDCFEKCSSLKNSCSLAYIKLNQCKLYSKVDYGSLISSIDIILFQKSIDDYSSITPFLTNHWTFNNNFIDSITGKSLANGLNAVTFTKDRLNSPSSALYINNGYIQAPSDIYFNGDFTISFWIKAYTMIGGNARIFSFLDKNSGGGNINAVEVILQGNTQPALHMVTNGGSVSVRISPIPLKIGTKWHHIAVTLKGTTYVIYLDGKNVIQGSIFSPIKAFRTLCFFGRSFWGGDPAFKGELDDMKIFNKSLSSTEILRVLNSF